MIGGTVITPICEARQVYESEGALTRMHAEIVDKELRLRL